MKRYLKTEAIVLKKKILLNKDKIVTLLTKDFGRLSLLAKGVRKITSRRLPHLETSNLIEAQIYRKEDRFYLQETSLISGFYKIKKREDKYSCLYQALLIVDRLLPENQPEREVYYLTKKLLIDLSEKEEVAEKVRIFLPKTLYLLGYIKSPQSLEGVDKLFDQIIGNHSKGLI